MVVTVTGCGRKGAVQMSVTRQALQDKRVRPDKMRHFAASTDQWRKGDRARARKLKAEWRAAVQKKRSCRHIKKCTALAGQQQKIAAEVIEVLDGIDILTNPPKIAKEYSESGNRTPSCSVLCNHVEMIGCESERC